MVMVLRTNAPAWDGYGDPEIAGNCTLFPAPQPNDDPWFDDQDEAASVCNGESGGRICPLREQCLQFALVNNEFHGVWGGTHEHDRKRLRKAWPKKKWGSVKWEPPTPKPGDEPSAVDPLAQLWEEQSPPEH